jgi:hypothetical protein
MLAVIVVEYGELSSVAIARVDWHLQGADFAEPVGDYPEALCWEVAAMVARARGLPIAGPNGVVQMG